MTCNRSVGLVQRIIEEAGISTVSISIARKLTEEAGAPRSVFVKWPMGHPMGEPFNIKQQRRVLKAALEGLLSITECGTIVDLPFRWRREEDLGREILWPE